MKQYRVLDVQGNLLVTQPLDGVSPQRLKVRSPAKYVENEILTVEVSSASRIPGKPVEGAVISSRIDPTLIGARLPTIKPFGESTEDEYQFDEYVS
jgi:hypothetical protein